MIFIQLLITKMCNSVQSLEGNSDSVPIFVVHGEQQFAQRFQSILEIHFSPCRLLSGTRIISCMLALFFIEIVESASECGHFSKLNNLI